MPARVTMSVLLKMQDQLTGPMQKLVGVVEGIGKRMNSQWVNTRFVISDTQRVVTALAKSMIQMGTSASAQMEVYEAQLTTVLGSMEEADAMLKDLIKFSATTPFEIQNVVESAIALENLGLAARENLTIVGNTAAAFGGDIREVANALASMSAEVLRRYGVEVRRTADTATFRWRDQHRQMQEITVKGGIEMTRATLLAIWNERYAGAMEQYSKTWHVMMSNLRDQWLLFKLDVQESGIFDTLKQEAARLLATINKLREEGNLQQWAKSISGAMEKVAKLFSVERMVAWGQVAVETFFHVRQGIVRGIIKMNEFLIKLNEGSEKLRVFQKAWSFIKLDSVFNPDKFKELYEETEKGSKHIADLRLENEELEASLAGMNKKIKKTQDLFQGLKTKTEAATASLKVTKEETDKMTESLEKQEQALEENTRAMATLASQMNEGIVAGVRKAQESYGQFTNAMETATVNLVKSMEQTFGQFFSGVLRGQVRSANDLLVSFGNSAINILSNLLAQMALFGASGTGGLLGGIFPQTQAKAGSSPSAAPVGSPLPARALGTLGVLRTGAAINHRGEKIVPANVAREQAQQAQVTVVNVIDPSAITDVMGSEAGGQVIINRITSDILRNGSVRQALKES